MAKADPDYDFIAIVTQASRISEQYLERFFVPLKEMDVTMAGMRALRRGIRYTKSAPHYLFRRC